MQEPKVAFLNGEHLGFPTAFGHQGLLTLQPTGFEPGDGLPGGVQQNRPLGVEQDYIFQDPGLEEGA